jgi:hypothetical protein
MFPSCPKRPTHIEEQKYSPAPCRGIFFRTNYLFSCASDIGTKTRFLDFFQFFAVTIIQNKFGFVPTTCKRESSMSPGSQLVETRKREWYELRNVPMQTCIQEFQKR